MKIYEKARLALAELCNEFSSSGVLSVYLYGSITTDDYIPDESDVDSIAIVESNTQLDLEDTMEKYLRDHNSDIARLGVRILYVNELEEQSEKGSNLTFFIPPKLLLLDMPNWEHVCGKEFSQEDFPPVSPQEGVEEALKVLGKWDWLEVENVREEKCGNYVKVIARILYYLHQAKGDQYTFSYELVFQHSDQYRDLAKLIANFRASDSPYKVFDSNRVVFQSFVDELKASV